MQILLDTQSIIWSLEDKNKITFSAQDKMLAADAVFVSAVSKITHRERYWLKERFRSYYC